MSFYAGRIVIEVDSRAVGNAESAAVLIASAADGVTPVVRLVKVCVRVCSLMRASS